MLRQSSTLKRRITALFSTLIFVSILVCTVILLINSNSITTNAANLDSKFTVRVDSVLELSLETCNSNNNSIVSISITPSSAGTFRSNCQTITVNTNMSGYTLSAKATGSNANYESGSVTNNLLYQNSYDTTAINSTPIIPITLNTIGSTPAPLDNDTWGFAVEGNTALGFDTTYTVDNSNNKFAQLSTIDTTIHREEDNWPLQQTAHKFYYGAKLTPHTMAGTYATTITYTAIGQEPEGVVDCEAHVFEEITDPTAYAWEQGTLASATGQNRDNPDDLARRFRTAGYIPVDESWSMVRVSVFSDLYLGPNWMALYYYDESYGFISRESSYSSAFSFTLPANTAYVRFVTGTDNTAVTLSATDFEGDIWFYSYTPGTCGELESYTLITQDLVPNHTSSNTSSGEQGANFVNGELWHATPSADGHATTDGSMYIHSVNWDTYTLTRTHLFTHNFGHLNSFSYDSNSNNLIFGNGSGSYTQAPEFFVVDVGNINLDGANTLDSVSATRFAVPGNFGAKCNVIWTDTADIAIMFTNDASVIRRIRLAKGAEQLTHGNYSSTGANEYNGTWEVLSTHFIQSPYDVLQGAAYIDGKIFAGFGHGPLAVGVIELLDEGIMDYKVWQDTSGSTSNMVTAWYDNATGRYGGYWGNRLQIWDSLPFTFTDN